MAAAISTSTSLALVPFYAVIKHFCTSSDDLPVASTSLAYFDCLCPQAKPTAILTVSCGHVQQTTFRCRKCRRLLATKSNAVPESEASSKPLYMGTPYQASQMETPSVQARPYEWPSSRRCTLMHLTTICLYLEAAGHF